MSLRYFVKACIKETEHVTEWQVSRAVSFVGSCFSRRSKQGGRSLFFGSCRLDEDRCRYGPTVAITRIYSRCRGLCRARVANDANDTYNR